MTHKDTSFVAAPGNQPVAGALFVSGASVTIAIIGALVKAVSVDLSLEMIVFFRSILTLVFLLPILFRPHNRTSIRTTCFRFHILRSLAGLAGMYCFFFILARLPLAVAVLLNFTSPIFIPLIAYFWIKEPVPAPVRAAIFIGFVGVALILKPGSELFRPIAFLGILSAILVATAMVAIRRMSPQEPPHRIVFYFSLIAALISAVPLLWAFQLPRGQTLGLLVLISLLAVAGQLMLTKGYSLAPSARVGPFTYGSVIFSAIIGWLVWDEALDLLTGLGAILICLAGILATFKTKAQPGPVTPGSFHLSQSAVDRKSSDKPYQKSI